MKNFIIKNIQTVVFLGYSPQIEELFHICEKLSLKPVLVTSPDQKKLINKNVPCKIFSKIDKNFEKYINTFEVENCLFISLGARWIFSKESIKNIFQNNLINAHGTRLPFDAGGGGMSWRIMKRDRICLHLLHLVNKEIDKGGIIFTQKSIFPKYCNIPEDFNKFYRDNFLGFFETFLLKLKNSEKFEVRDQVDYIGSYFPRLSTLKNGFIDWSWSSQNISYFIDAFDSPYEGASTFIGDRLVKIKKCQLHGGEVSNHPFMSGLITRHDQKWIIVSTQDQFSLIIEEIYDEKGKNILSKIKVGDRFHTPTKYLNESFSKRAIFGPLGEK